MGVSQTRTSSATPPRRRFSAPPSGVSCPWSVPRGSTFDCRVSSNGWCVWGAPGTLSVSPGPVERRLRHEQKKTPRPETSRTESP